MIKDCDLIERVRWITDAVSGQDLASGALSSYLIRNGHIHATDGRMVVGTPFPFEGQECLVPAEQFEKVLINRPEGDFSWERDLDRLILKRGRFKGRIKTLPLDMWVMPTDLPVGMESIPDDLIPAVTRLLPFVSDNATKPWAMCFCIYGYHAYASNNVVVARVPFEISTVGWQGEGEDCIERAYSIPKWVGEFIKKREEGLAMWHCGDSHITFLWEDGSWMRSSLILDPFPPVKAVFDQYFNGELPVEVTSEYRKCLARIEKIADDPVVRLRLEECVGSTGEVLSVEDGAGTPVPEGMTETVWDLRYLLPVLQLADTWDPCRYPSPAPWSGKGVQGIIMGRRD